MEMTVILAFLDDKFNEIQIAEFVRKVCPILIFQIDSKKYFELGRSQYTTTLVVKYTVLLVDSVAC